MFETVRAAYVFLPLNERRALLWQFPLALLAAILETLGTAVLFTAVAAFTLDEPASLAAWMSWLSPEGESPQERIKFWALAVIALFLTKNLVLVAIHYHRNRFFAKSASELAKRLFRHYLDVPLGFHHRHPSSELIRNLTEGTDHTIGFVLGSSIHIVTIILFIIGILLVVVSISPVHAMVAAVVFGLMIFGLLKLIQRRHQHLGEIAHSRYQGILAELQHGLSNVDQIKMSGKSAFFVNRWSDHQQDYMQANYSARTLTTSATALLETLLISAVMLLALTVVIFSQGDTDTLIPVLALYGYTGIRLLPLTNQLIQYTGFIRTCTPSVWAIKEHLDLHSETEDGGHSLVFNQTISLSSVGLMYSDGTEALTSINLTINKGESIALVGSTGSGKTSLVYLIAGLLSPSQGEVKVDEQSLQDYRQAWRRHVGYVPQQIELLDDILRRNVAFGLDDEEIDDEQVIRALKQAGLDLALDSQIGENGGRLSGGQRQRLAIARALYSDPEVIILDEATASLDSETEKVITETLEHLRGQKTIITVAHRLSTVRGCDRLLLMEEGRIVDQGNFDTLYQSNDRFKRMVDLSHA